MKTIAVIAEFNPFTKGHEMIIKKAKEETLADFVVVIMSGDFVQRGEAAIIDKFARTKAALDGGADLVLELPVYYALGSAEFFASGAISILDKMGVTDGLLFGSESGDITVLSDIAKVLSDEPDSFKETLEFSLQSGLSFPKAREAALLTYFGNDTTISEALKRPNNILGIEYIKAIIKRGSSIKPYTIKRIGSDYNESTLSPCSSATAIRTALHKDIPVDSYVPAASYKYIAEYEGKYGENNALSELLLYKLLSDDDYSGYLDVSLDMADKIRSNIDNFESFHEFAKALKSKDLTYSRISRALIHILLNITEKNMAQYREDTFTSYGRILGMKRDAARIIAASKDIGTLPIFMQLKEADERLSPLEQRLLEETLYSSKIYNLVFKKNIINEYRQKPIILN